MNQQLLLKIVSDFAHDSMWSVFMVECERIQLCVMCWEAVVIVGVI